MLKKCFTISGIIFERSRLLRRSQYHQTLPSRIMPNPTGDFNILHIRCNRRCPSRYNSRSLLSLPLRDTRLDVRAPLLLMARHRGRTR